MSTMIVTFPGGKRVDAELGGYTIRHHQPSQGGGEGTAPPPFDLFLAAIATCAGIYVKATATRGASRPEGLGLEMQIEREPRKAPGGPSRPEIRLPEGFPEKHREVSSGRRTSARSRAHPAAAGVRGPERLASPRVSPPPAGRWYAGPAPMKLLLSYLRPHWRLVLLASSWRRSTRSSRCSIR